MLRSTLSLWVVLGAAACQSAGGSPPGGPEAPRPPSRLRASDSLSPTARALISRRMENHGYEMTNLMWATLMLDRTEAAQVSQTILSEPRLARPIGRDELNAQLPEAFFDHQDRLVEAARGLQSVAQDESSTPDALAEAFGRLTGTCVGCHAVYLYGKAGAR